ncbi:TM2 domain-containing protein [Levilactobacillus tujiorum]|uniref:TM2 domain-containing protein n=1 Tax=Levilactobacillus tujiorum TaxID=2912243 RepID=A0ABX1L634_9LACO|nr:TM2 domain-containing protein [Levilactobacillus tujiorum]MCH5464729.1 TM2 domain-containing protein [Levilactobacillus tujiorum]NLR11791.1 TM2 domain-containing protein [Lactobacillus sp. HBUAS51387]NLR29708.1 TM2 domain-containing protein [Levilactobacillus tujiorum]
MYNNQYLKSQLTNEEVLVVNSEIERQKKSTAVAFLLCLFLGTLGAHRYYMGKNGSAIAMTLITVLTLGLGAFITGIWAFIDLFLITTWLRENQDEIENTAAQQILSKRGSQTKEATENNID